MAFRQLKNIIIANNRQYQTQKLQKSPVVVICMDGFGNEYFQAAESNKSIPALSQMKKQGHFSLVKGAMPSLTNPNNMCIVTGTTPDVHGICGNYFLNPLTKEPIMMNDSKFIKCQHTILSQFYHEGYKIGAITGKNKLLSLLSHDLQFNAQEQHHPICFSAEEANNVNFAKNGINDINKILGKAPDVYSAEASIYVLKAGVYLQSQPDLRRDLLYLSTTDYIFHKYRPEEKESLDYIKEIDNCISNLLELGCIVGLTADHGMSQKQGGIIFLDQYLTDTCNVILPITDPYVKHHASLGSFALVYLGQRDDIQIISQNLSKIKGVEKILTGDQASKEFQLPRDRIGDLVVIADKKYVLGSSPSNHDISQLDRPLRSHGGLSEQIVPLILSIPLTNQSILPQRNFDVFNYCLNN